jgi:hypothetical protein
LEEIHEFKLSDKELSQLQNAGAAVKELVKNLE